MTAKKLRVGVTGSSFGANVHVPAWNAQGGFTVVAIASPSRASEVAQQRGIPNAYATIDEMLAGCELDIVSIASPPFAHRNQVLAALRAGKHVLCEKPFGLDVAECEEMVEAAARAGTVCAIAHEFRYLSDRQALKELVANDHLGALREIEVAWSGSNLRAETERPNSWWFERSKGGGLTGAILSHLIDQATWLAGRAPVRSQGFERTANPERRGKSETFTSDVADGAFALIDYGEGLAARVAADGTHAVDASLAAVHGESRTAVTSGRSIVQSTLFSVDAEETAELECAPQPHANLSAAHPNLPAFVTMLDAFAEAAAGASASLPSFADGLATQRVLESVGYGAKARAAR